MQIKFVLDKGYPHGEIIEVRDYDDDTPDIELLNDLHDWVLSQTMCSFEKIT